MNKFSMIAFILGISPMSTSSVFCEILPEKNLFPNKIQNSKKAIEFFDNELNFRASAYDVNLAVQGKTPNITIIDLRKAEDFARDHIPGAINLPWDQYDSFKGPEVDYPGLRKDGFNYVYCYRLFCNLGQQAAKKFASLGYPVKEIMGGYEEWKREGYPVEK